MSGTQARRIGRYEILDTLGQGGMGVVYLANDPVLGRKVAVKTILASNFATEDQDDLLHRLLKEGQAAANMRHPGIVTVFDAMQQGDETYIVMEYVAGRKLSDLLKDRPDHETAIRILREIAQALDYAHEQGIVHRDIKPDNILLDAAGKVRIADFGIAKSLSRHSITPGAVGTPHYMSPEQIRNEDEIDGKADQFSLGVIAYSMLTGRKPFDGKSQLAIGQKIVGEDPPRASKVDKSLSPDVDTVLLRSLAKQPKERYPTCMAFVEDLERAIDGTELAEPGPDYFRWLRIAAVVLLVAAAGFAAWKWWPTPEPSFKLTVDSHNAPITSGHHFPSGDRAVPGPGDLSATVTADHAISAALPVELVLLADGQTVDHVALKPDAAGMKHVFTAAMPPGEYVVRLNVGGVAKGNLGFVIDPPPAPPPPTWALEIRMMNNPVTEGQKLNKKDPEYPPPGYIGPKDLTATVTSPPDHPVSIGTPVRVEWTRDGKPLSAVDLTSADLNKPLPLAASPRGPDPGEYTVKLTAEGQEKTVSFTIVAATPPPILTPVKPAGEGTIPPPVQQTSSRGLLGLEVSARDCHLTNGQHFKADDENCGQLGPRELTARVTEKKPVPPGADVELVWSVDDKETDRLALGPDAFGTQKPYRNIAEPGQYTVRVLVNRTLQSEFRFVIEK